MMSRLGTFRLGRKWSDKQWCDTHLAGQDESKGVQATVICKSCGL